MAPCLKAMGPLPIRRTDYTGSDSFTYTVEDGFGNTATGTIDVTVAPSHIHLVKATVTPRTQQRLSRFSDIEPINQ